MNLRNESLFVHAFEHAPIGMALVGTDGKWLKVNASLCEIIGYSEQELLSMDFQTLTHEDDLEKDLRHVKQIIDGQSNHYQMEKRYYHKHGHIVWIMLSASLVRDEQGKPLYFISQILNITDRKLTELCLIQNKQRYQSLIEQYPDMIVAISLEGKLLFANDVCEQITGYTKEDILQMNPLIPVEDVSMFCKHFQLAAMGEAHEHEGNLFHKLGHRVPIRVTYVPIIVNHIIEGVYCIVKDISEFKRATEQMRHHQGLYELISENADELICYGTPDGITQYVSPSVKTLLGYTPDEVLGKSCADFWHPDDAIAVKNQKEKEKSDTAVITSRVRHKDGHYIWFETTVKAIRDESGSIQKVMGVGRDITERMIAEEAIKKNEENYRRLVEELPEAIVIAKEDKWLFVNDAAVKLLGASSKSEILNRCVWEIVHPDFHENVKRRIEIADQARQPLPATEEKLIRSDGTVIDAEIECFPAMFANEPVRYQLIRDITERKQAQEVIINSEKLSIAGQLAAGIAHEIRNPLTAIKGFLKLLEHKFKEKIYYFDIIDSEIERIEQFIHELLILAKPQAVHYDKKDVRFILKQIITLMESQALLKNVQFQAGFDEDALTIYCDENQLKQVFINFIKNAIESMQDGGKLTVMASKKKSGKQVEIAISDQGCGIPQEQMSKLGQPFYTTKENGTGLGFMVSKKIIEHHSGTIKVISEVNVGTQILIYLPCYSNI